MKAFPRPITDLPSGDVILRVKNVIEDAVIEWMKAHGYLRDHFSGITDATGSCESVANVFFVENVGGGPLKTLQQTAQLKMEELIIRHTSISRLYTIGRSFRRERNPDNSQAWAAYREESNDGRHLSDFSLVEWEALDMGLEKLVEDNESLFLHIMERVLQSNLLDRARLRTLYFWYELFKEKRTKISYRSAVDFLQSVGFSVEYGDDLSSAAELLLTQEFGALHVTHYPEEIKFFNMRRSRDPQYTGCVDCADFLLPYAGESIGCSAREHEYHILSEKLWQSTMFAQLKHEYEARGGATEQMIAAFQRYLNLFKEGCYERAGAGMGEARVLQFIVASPAIIPW